MSLSERLGWAAVLLLPVFLARWMMARRWLPSRWSPYIVARAMRLRGERYTQPPPIKLKQRPMTSPGGTPIETRVA